VNASIHPFAKFYRASVFVRALSAILNVWSAAVLQAKNEDDIDADGANLHDELSAASLPKSRN
jgi:hypothetical protein